MSDARPSAPPHEPIAARPNGLATLTAKRERARRAMPPPRHPRGNSAPDGAGPAAAAPRIPGGPAGEPPEAATPTRDHEAAQTPTPTEPAAPETAPRTPTPSPEETGATFKVTLYVDRATDEFMEAARVAGLTSRPKVDVSRSAVMRLALRRLMDDMTPDQVKQHLESQVVRTTGPGRRRR